MVMKMIRRGFILLAVIAALASVAGVVAAHRGEAGSASKAAPKSTFSVRQARAFADFPLYDAGSAVEGWPLVAVLHRSDPTATYVSFIYGDCQATDDLGCAPPVEVQVWPACIRNPSLYKSSQPGAPTPENTTARGVPAAFFEGGQRLEIQTGTSTVVVFASTRDDALRVASALRGVNVPVQAAAPLPEPATGALTGTLRCA